MKGAMRVVLKLHKQLVPTQVAVLPLLKKNDEIVAMAQALKKDMIESGLINSQMSRKGPRRIPGKGC